MKALTLTQPWATLVAAGIKQIETRSWQTHYRGPIAIHAASSWTTADEEFAWTLYRHKILTIVPTQLPLGAILAVVEITGCVSTNGFHPPRAEAEYGNFEPDRWAWLLGERRELKEPIPARGSLGLWTWDGEL